MNPQPATRNSQPGNDRTIQVQLCPNCNTANPADQLSASEYRCRQCGFELAYLEYTASGAIRGVLGWVKRPGALLLDRYEVISILGRGGFGATYLVKDLRLSGKRRAVKEIPQNIFDENEPMLLSRLSHSHIPDIMDRFEDGGMNYLVLEFAGGHSLGNKARELGGKIPLAVLAPWACQLCDVLGYLHSQKPPIIHRDLKPDNVLLDENGRLMLVDFGIAKAGDKSEETRTLGRAVSYNYSSPEQIMGTGTDQLSDVFSLGATLYFLLTGQHPPAINKRLGETLKSLATLLPGIPPEIDRAIIQALDLNPDKRPSIQEVGKAFRSFSQAPAGRPPEQEPRTTNKLIVFSILLAAFAAAAAGFLYFSYFRKSPEVEQTRTTGQESILGREPATGAQPPVASPPPAVTSDLPAARVMQPPESLSGSGSLTSVPSGQRPAAPQRPATEDILPPPAAGYLPGPPAASLPPAIETVPPEPLRPQKDSTTKPAAKGAGKTPVPAAKPPSVPGVAPAPTASGKAAPAPAPAAQPVTEEKEKPVDWGGALQWKDSREKVQ